MRLLAVVMLVGCALSGCSLVSDGQQVWGILQEEAKQQEVLAATLHDLRELDSVDTVSSRFLADGSQGDEADIDVVAKAGSTTTALVAMAEIARAAFASPELGSARSKFTLTVGELSTLRTEAFHPTAEVLADEVTFWRAAETAIGAELSVHLGGDGGSGHVREIAPAAQPGEDFAFTERFLKAGNGLLALNDGWSSSTFWIMPGMTATPGLPPAEVFSLLESIRAEYPLSNPRAASEGAQMWWQGEEHGLTVVYLQDRLRESDWPAVISLAQRVAAAAIPGSSFLYQTQADTDFKQYRFHVDECVTEVTVGPDDRALADALAASGTPIPVAGGPGFCAWS
jgi:hypothetical protein